MKLSKAEGQGPQPAGTNGDSSALGIGYVAHPQRQRAGCQAHFQWTADVLCGGGISQRQRRLAREKRCEEECICRETSIVVDNKCLGGQTQTKKEKKKGFAERVNVFCRGQVMSQDLSLSTRYPKWGLGRQDPVVVAVAVAMVWAQVACHRALMAGGLNGKGQEGVVR